ncbi:hypothetical protein [Rickettsiales endosymbiont of Stachyamoeba lipophora]|uniref:hypothetical protein n=1 Tax=Rickettsiales endosymbiont of Stachyamoeba lipophora TaxID=2486578 RepID=UPI000F652820|nr:hypothetical protein [Rickettsiales endosymbiont of Stachyamoeba lipophora]AZL16039.1 hypothetical protein EF513_05755 [Rickettsiales endosymbiont of Stachyamoeba lipophora]
MLFDNIPRIPDLIFRTSTYDLQDKTSIQFYSGETIATLLLRTNQVGLLQACYNKFPGLIANVADTVEHAANKNVPQETKAWVLDPTNQALYKKAFEKANLPQRSTLQSSTQTTPIQAPQQPSAGIPAKDGYRAASNHNKPSQFSINNVQTEQKSAQESMGLVTKIFLIITLPLWVIPKIIYNVIVKQPALAGLKELFTSSNLLPGIQGSSKKQETVPGTKNPTYTAPLEAINQLKNKQGQPRANQAGAHINYSPRGMDGP